MVDKLRAESMKSSAPRILMFAPGFAPFGFSENIVNSKLALALLNRGWQVDVVSRLDEGPVYSADWEEPWIPLKGSTYTVEYRHGNRIYRLVDLSRQLLRVHFLVAGVRWAGRALDLAIALHKKHRYQIVLSRSPNDVGHVPALAFSRYSKVPWIANWNDPPDHLWPFPYNNSRTKLAELISKRLLLRVLNEAGMVTFPSERLRSHVLRSVGRSCLSNTSVLPHVGLTEYVPSTRVSDGYFRICHAGNLSRERNPGTFLEGVARFLAQTHLSSLFEVRLLGVDDHVLTQAIQNARIGAHIKILGNLNYLTTLRNLDQSDVLVVVEAPCEEGIFLPSKVVDYVQAGRPLLAISPRKGTMSDLLSETGAGEFAACGEPDSVASALSRLYRSWKAGLLHRAYPVERLWEHFRPENVIKQYEEIFSFLQGIDSELC